MAEKQGRDDDDEVDDYWWMHVCLFSRYSVKRVRSQLREQRDVTRKPLKTETLSDHCVMLSIRVSG